MMDIIAKLRDHSSFNSVSERSMLREEAALRIEQLESYKLALEEQIARMTAGEFVAPASDAA
jgi:hypothetical protein